MATMTKKPMKEVSHTSPYGTGADRVWERGHEYETADYNTDTTDSTTTPADD